MKALQIFQRDGRLTTSLPQIMDTAMANLGSNTKIDGEMGKRKLGKEMLTKRHVILVSLEGDVSIKETILGKDPIAVNGTIKDSVISCFHNVTQSIKISQIPLSKQPHLHFQGIARRIDIKSFEVRVGGGGFEEGLRIGV